MAEDRDAGLGDLERQVRDALTHLYDLAHLQTHPLARRLRERGGPSATGVVLRQELLDAIEWFRPAAGTPTTSKAYRRYRVLELRYIEGSSRSRSSSTSRSARASTTASTPKRSPPSSRSSG